MIIKKMLTSALFMFSVFVYGQNTILWKVTSTKKNHISYLFGTNHLFGNSFVDSFPIIKEKILASALIVTETKLDKEKTSAYYNSRPISDSLSTILSKEDFEFIANIFKKGQIDIRKFTPGEIFVNYRPFIPSLNVTQ